MKCIVCNGNDIVIESVDEQIKCEKDIVIVSLNVMVCSSCGERYYSRKNIREIEFIRDSYKSNKLKTENIGNVLRAQAA
jgi:YgiT-type zinc finger domain-containing protein